MYLKFGCYGQERRSAPSGERRHGYLGKLCPADFEEQSAGSFGTAHRNGAKTGGGKTAHYCYPSVRSESM